MPVRLEIEAKYQVPSERLFEKLLSLGALGPYALVITSDLHTEDRYYDTSGWQLYRQGYACRMRRQQEGQWIVGLKGIGGVEGAIHRREEYEQAVPANTSLSALPEGVVRQKLTMLVDPILLSEVCRIDQIRRRRRVRCGEREVGELSLDSVRVVAERSSSEFLQAEVELASEACPEELTRLDADLRKIGLIPEPRSKFERALIEARVGEVRGNGSWGSLVTVSLTDNTTGQMDYDEKNL